MNSFDHYKLLITPLSLVHIGTGESYEPTNYVIESDTLYEFDTGSAIEAFGERERQQLLNAVNRRPGTEMIVAVQKLFHEQRKALLANSVHRIPVLDGVANFYRDRVGQVAQRETSGHAVVNRLEIDRTAFNPVTHLPVLFGSSLKGAIRTALLDCVNDGRPAQEGKGLHEFQGRLFRYRHPDRGSLRLECDPMRLLQISDAIWHGDSGLPATEVHLAVNRKKAPVVDERGRLRASQAEQKGLYQILECVPAMRYRTFTAQLNIQHVDSVERVGELPDRNLRFSIRDIARACNAFYKPILRDEYKLLTERGYLSERWRQMIESLMDGEVGGKIGGGEAFLLRVGRHSGAEAVTLNGVRKIKIMEGRDRETGRQRSSAALTAKTVWLAAEEPDQQSDMLPFGWLLVEIHPLNGALPVWDTLKAACYAHLEPARAWAARQMEKAVELEDVRAEAATRRRSEEEEARRRAEETAQVAQAASERQARLAAMTPEERAIEGFRAFYSARKAEGAYRAGGVFDERRLGFFRQALAWEDATARQAAATLLHETIREWTDWPSRKERKVEFRDWLARLEGAGDS
jgi:CRISPR-associated protein Csm5